jgi:hypothetical protein
MSPNSRRLCWRKSPNLWELGNTLMNRSLAAALRLGFGLGLAATLAGTALAQSPWPAAPAPGQPAQAPAQASPSQSPWPSSAPAQSSAPWPSSSPQQSGFPPAGGGGFPSGGGGGAFGAPPPGAMSPVCASFPTLRDEAQKKASVVQAIGSHKPPDRAKMCAAVTAFYGAEQKVVAFLETNKSKCGVPDQAVQQAKLIHTNTEKFKDQVCAEGPKPKIPTLSEAITTTPVDTPKNTKTGPGTFNTLTGNPLGN